LQVEHRHIRAVQDDLPHCIATVSGNAHHVDARQRPKQRGQACADHRMIIGQHHPYVAHDAINGNEATT
jgi:hypothetical protein